MHVDHLPITLLPIYNRSDENEGIFADEISYASFVLAAVASVRCEIKLEC